MRSLRLIYFICGMGMLGGSGFDLHASDESDLRVARPNWAAELQYSFRALGDHPIVPLQAGANPATAFLLSLEYAPAWFQKLGVLSIGPLIEYLSIVGFNPSILAGNVFPLFMAGAQVRYQLRYLDQQLFVPIVGYSYEYFSYKFASGPQGQFWVKGPSGGLMIFLNALDEDSALQFYRLTGIQRSYVVFNYRALHGTDGTVSLTGGSFYVGLRLEM